MPGVASAAWGSPSVNFAIVRHPPGRKVDHWRLTPPTLVALRLHDPGSPIADHDRLSVAESSVGQPGGQKVLHDLLDALGLRMSGAVVGRDAEIDEPKPVPDGARHGADIVDEMETA